MAYFQTKIPIWVNSGGSWNGSCWYILWSFGLSYGHFGILCGKLVYFMAIWYIFPFWYVLPKKSGTPAPL
jgi:hypothetical protein